MARKHAKEQSIDFFYLQQNQKENKKKRATKTRPHPEKKKKTQNKKGQAQENKDEIFNFDNEIVIGVNVIPEKKEEKRKDNKSSKKKNKKQKERKKVQKRKDSPTTAKKVPPKKKITKQEQKRQERKRRRNKLLLKIFLLLLLLTGFAAFFLLTPIFNISEIQVEGNEKVSPETIISLSGLQKGENIFRFTKSGVENKIKQEPYVQQIEIQRKIPNTVVLSIKERHTKYVIEVGNAYLYLNNQGYFLELSETKPEVPILKGYTTKIENLVPGNRLEQEDLEKMEMVIRIMDSASNNEVQTFITAIDIQDKNNYTIYLDGEQKIAYIGDASNLNDKMWVLKKILEQEAGKKGQIFLNEEQPFFREDVSGI